MWNARFLTEDELDEAGFIHRGKNVLVHSTSVIVNAENMFLGDNIRVDPFCVLSASHTLKIGSHVHIASHCTLVGSEVIDLGDFVGISHGSKILSSTDDFKGACLTGPTIPHEFTNVLSWPVHIGRHVVVGANCLVLPGSRIGEGTTIGALSLVKGEVEEWALYGGVPARRIGSRDREGVLDAEDRFKKRGG